MLPLTALACLLMYQSTNPGLYYLVGMGVYFWAFSEGEVRFFLFLKFLLYCRDANMFFSLDNMCKTLDSTSTSTLRRQSLRQRRGLQEGGEKEQGTFACKQGNPQGKNHWKQRKQGEEKETNQDQRCMYSNFETRKNPGAGGGRKGRIQPSQSVSQPNRTSLQEASPRVSLLRLFFYPHSILDIFRHQLAFGGVCCIVLLFFL